jgi:tetratricopeptide (TPR) repeat protein
VDAARAHHADLAKATSDPTIEKMLAWDRYSLIGGVKIAERVAAAEIARAGKDHDGAIAALREAVAIEDSLPYDEPPAWNAPTRQALGATLLAAGKAAEAETAYREELERNPENGWSLHGLEKSLRAQKKTAEADEVKARFTAAWANADVDLDKL